MHNSHNFGFFFFHLSLSVRWNSAKTFRECLHNPFWVTRKSLTICLRPGTAQNSSKALLLLSTHLSLPLYSQGFSSWLHCSQERAFSCPSSFMASLCPEYSSEDSAQECLGTASLAIWNCAVSLKFTGLAYFTQWPTGEDTAHFFFFEILVGWLLGSHEAVAAKSGAWPGSICICASFNPCSLLVPRERSHVCWHILWQLYVLLMHPTRESPGSLLPSEPSRLISPSFHNPPP